MRAPRRTFAAIVVPIVIVAVPHARLQPGPVAECFLFARGTDLAPVIVSDPAECARPSAPASTFKIPHALIALQAGVVTPHTMVKWDGTDYEFESWRADHTLDSAIKRSVLPFFQRTARLIGRDRMREQLDALDYAHDGFDGEIDAFWINGDLVVSPMEQWTFLQRLFSRRLPIGAEHVAVVVRAITMPAGQIVNAAGTHAFAPKWPKGTVVRAKTGNTTVKGERVSWLVGALELQGADYVFVARARSRAPLDGTAGADVALRGLNAAGPQ